MNHVLVVTTVTGGDYYGTKLEPPREGHSGWDPHLPQGREWDGDWMFMGLSAGSMTLHALWQRPLKPL